MRRGSAIFAAVAALALGNAAVLAAPYASNVVISGTSVSFILNEPAPVLTVSVNGGPETPLDGSSSGTKSFSLGAPGQTFSIHVKKASDTGYSVPTGGTITAAATGLSQNTSAGGANQISSDSNPLNRFNSPRGVGVSTNPNSPNYGTAYIANSAAGSTTGVVRAVGDGLYAVHADQSDAYGYGNTAQDPGNKFDGVAPASANSPFRTAVGPSGDVYISDFSDSNGNVWMNNPNMTVGTQLLGGVGGPTALPVGQNHGSTTAAAVVGSLSGSNLVLYTLDEDLTTSQVTGSGSALDKNSLWRYNVNGGPVPYSTMPTKVNQSDVLVSGATSDLAIGANGKFYLNQNRSAGGEAGIVVLNTDGTTAFDSLTASRTLLGNPTAADIFRNIVAIDVSPDQKWLAGMVNNSDIVVIPLDANGIPDIANRLLVDTGTDVVSGRDIAFDAADNIHYVSSGQALYRVYSPGGLSDYVLSYNGTAFSGNYNLAVPEPASLGLLGLAGLGLLRRKSRRA